MHPVVRIAFMLASAAFCFSAVGMFALGRDQNTAMNALQCGLLCGIASGVYPRP